MIITFLLYLLYFCITAKGRSINPYCRDIRYLIIYLWRANRVLAAIWTTAEETLKRAFLGGTMEILLLQWLPHVGAMLS